MPKTLDPADPHLTAFLKSLEAKDELAVRLALRGEFANLRGNRSWTARIDALRDELGLDEDGLARILRQAEISGDAIRKVVRKNQRR